jgi:hypothetical protein
MHHIEMHEKTQPEHNIVQLVFFNDNNAYSIRVSVLLEL